MTAMTITGSSRPHVAYIGHSAAMSGAEIALARLLGAQPAIDPLVILAEHGPLVGRLHEIGVETVVMPLDASAAAVTRSQVTHRGLSLGALGSSGRYAVRLAAMLRRRGVDLVHTNSMKAHLYGGVAARFAGVPQVWHARDRAADDYLPMPAVRVVRWAARSMPRFVVANSRATLRTYLGVRHARVVYDATPPHVRRHPAPPARPLRIGMVGRIAPWKGQDVFLRAFAAAFARGDQQAVLIGDAMFGERSHAASLRRLAIELGIIDRVAFIGHVDGVGPQLDRLHVVVHCSTIPEPFGQVVVEGMAAGLPVVASAAGGPTEIVDDGCTGMLTPPGDVEALAVALKRLDGDAELRRRLGSAAATASRDFLPERVARELTTVYHAVLGRNITRDPTSGTDHSRRSSQ